VFVTQDENTSCYSQTTLITGTQLFNFQLCRNMVLSNQVDESIAISMYRMFELTQWTSIDQFLFESGTWGPIFEKS